MSPFITGDPPATTSVHTALEAHLKADATLTGMLYSRVAVFHRDVPREASVPCVVFNKQSGRDVYAFGARAFVEQVWLVKGIDRGRHSARVEEIAAQIDVVLMDAELVLDSGLVLYCRRETEVDYGETTGPDTFHHCGGEFRVVTTP